jgi:hypothetical protein
MPKRYKCEGVTFEEDVMQELQAAMTTIRGH